MKIIKNVSFKFGKQATHDTRLARVLQAMLDAQSEHPESDDNVRVVVAAMDVATNEGIVLSTNTEYETRAIVLLTTLQAELKGTGTKAIIVADRGQG